MTTTIPPPARRGRYCTGHPDGYDGDDLELSMSLTGRQLETLRRMGATAETQAAYNTMIKATSKRAQNRAAKAFESAFAAARLEYGAALAFAYAGRCYRLGDLVLDFTSAEAALATMDNPDLPAVVLGWLRIAPFEANEFALELTRKSFTTLKWSVSPTAGKQVSHAG